MLVDRWGVARYIIKNLGNSSFQLRPFGMGRFDGFSQCFVEAFNGSVSHRPVWCYELVVNTATVSKYFNLCEINWGPLSDTISAG